jgi:hypothetical protein
MRDSHREIAFLFLADVRLLDHRPEDATARARLGRLTSGADRALLVKHVAASHPNR